MTAGTTGSALTLTVMAGTVLPEPAAVPEGAARGAGPSGSAAASQGLSTMTRRADFLAAARARRASMPGFLLQARQRPAGDGGADAVRVGFTCSKKVGNAVARNRAKRRLRALARSLLASRGRPGWDYVLIGRESATATLDFAQMHRDLSTALDRVHGAAGGDRRPAR